MKKILVAFDSASFSDGALDYAFEFAKSNSSLVVGLFIEDLSYLSYTALFGEDYFAFDQRVLKKLEEESQGRLKENIQLFETRCMEAGVNFKTHLDKGVPANELIHESIFSDIIILGYHTFFSGVAGEGSILKDILSESHCPVLAVPQVCHPLETILLTYDGKPSSAFAIKQFICLFPDIIETKEVTLLHIAKSKEETPPGAGLMQEYLSVHTPKINFENLSGHPEDAILNFASIQNHPLIVMGAYGRSGVSRFFSKSTAEKLLREKSIPIFVTHH